MEPEPVSLLGTRWWELTRFVTLALLILLALPGAGQETNAAFASPVSVTNDAEQTLRVYLRLQEQLHAALLAVEQARLEASSEARANADRLASRLNVLEQALEQQQEEQRQAERSASRALTAVVMLTFGLGVAALILTAVLQNRGINRLAEIALGTSATRPLGWPSIETPPGPGGPRLLSASVKGPEGDRLLATIGRLEQHIHDLERSVGVSCGSGSLPETVAANGLNPPSLPAPERTVDPVAGLLGKGRTLLHLGQADKALPCFDEAIAKAPDNADAHLKRGLALERLQRPNDALLAYDQAITLSRFHTLASLRKAEILTQQERYAEALACYEQALRAEPKA